MAAALRMIRSPAASDDALRQELRQRTRAPSKEQPHVRRRSRTTVSMWNVSGNRSKRSMLEIS
jgi:hypothetical protein